MSIESSMFQVVPEEAFTQTEWKKVYDPEQRGDTGVEQCTIEGLQSGGFHIGKYEIPKQFQGGIGNGDRVKLYLERASDTDDAGRVVAIQVLKLEDDLESTGWGHMQHVE